MVVGFVGNQYLAVSDDPYSYNVRIEDCSGQVIAESARVLYDRDHNVYFRYYGDNEGMAPLYQLDGIQVDDVLCQATANQKYG